jgi:hypothetical protein
MPDRTPPQFRRPFPRLPDLDLPTAPREWMRPRTRPWIQPEPWPQPQPRDPDEERRRGRRAVTLRLPRAKARYIDRYESMIARRDLVHNYNYSRPDPSDPRQAARWRAELTPEAPGGIDQRMYTLGMRILRSLGMDQAQAHRAVLTPPWSRTVWDIPMSVDHVIELQLTFPHDRSWSNSIFNWALLDLSTNSSVGSRLANNIARERADLFAETWNFNYLFAPLIFETVVIDEYGSQGEHWDIHEIRRGDHVNALLNWIGA